MEQDHIDYLIQVAWELGETSGLLTQIPDARFLIMNHDQGNFEALLAYAATDIGLWGNVAPTWGLDGSPYLENDDGTDAAEFNLWRQPLNQQVARDHNSLISVGFRAALPIDTVPEALDRMRTTPGYEDMSSASAIRCLASAADLLDWVYFAHLTPWFPGQFAFLVDFTQDARLIQGLREHVHQDDDLRYILMRR